MKRISTILMILILLAVLAAGCQKQADPLPMSSGYGCAVYTEQGCSKQVVATGGEIQVESGGTLDLQSGATVDLAGTLANSGGSVTIADNFAVTGTSDLQGNVSDSGGVFTVADNVLVDGAADAIQFTVQGYVTQTSGLLVLEQSDGTDKLTVSNDGNLVVAGTSDLQGNLGDSGGALTAADNVLIDGAADAEQLVVQGNGTQTSNVFVVETSAGADKFTVSNDGNTDIAGTLNYGANNLYPLGNSSSGLQVVYGTAQITTTGTVAHGLTTVTWALCSLAEDSGATAGDAAFCSVSVSANVVTIKLWDDDVGGATEVDVSVNYIIIGAP